MNTKYDLPINPVWSQLEMPVDDTEKPRERLSERGLDLDIGGLLESRLRAAEEELAALAEVVEAQVEEMVRLGAALGDLMASVDHHQTDSLNRIQDLERRERMRL